MYSPFLQDYIINKHREKVNKTMLCVVYVRVGSFRFCLYVVMKLITSGVGTVVALAATHFRLKINIPNLL